MILCAIHSGETLSLGAFSKSDKKFFLQKVMCSGLPRESQLSPYYIKESCLVFLIRVGMGLFLRSDINLQ